MSAPRNASTEIGQRRKYTFRGTDYPSVTTILKYTPKEWLGAWAAKMVATEAVTGYEALGLAIAEQGTEAALRALKRVPWVKRDAAADFGSAKHEVLEALVAERTIPETVHHREIEQWRELYQPLVEFSEAQVVNTAVGYAGSLDLIAEVYGRRLLVDLKSSSVLDHVMRMQLAAYRYAEAVFVDDRIVAEMPPVEGCAVLWIPRDHPQDWQFIEVDAGAEAWRAFLNVKGTHDFLRGYEKRAVGELILPRALEVA